MGKTKDKWSALSIKDRAELINIYVKDGIMDLKKIKEHYNSFNSGGDLDGEKLSNIPIVEMTPTEVANANENLYKSQYMLPVGDSPDDPAYLVYEPLENAVVTAYREPKEEQSLEDQIAFARYIRDPKRLVGYTGDGISHDLGDTSLQDIATTAIGMPLLMSNPVGNSLLTTGFKLYNTPGIKQAADTYFTYKGLENLTSDNGVKKTINLFKDKKYLQGIKSGVGDLMDITGPLFLADDLYKFGKESVRLGKWITNSANDVLNIKSNEDAIEDAMRYYKTHVNPNIDKSDYAIRFKEALPRQNASGFYDPMSNTISIKNTNEAPNWDLRNTILHEMRHQDDPIVHKGFSSFTMGNDVKRPTGRISLDSGNLETLKHAYSDVLLDAEKVTTNGDVRSLLEAFYIKEFGNIPTPNQLNAYIESLPAFMLSFAKSVSHGHATGNILYNIFNTDYLKDALMFVKKDGGRLNKLYTGGDMTSTNNKTKDQLALELQSKSKNDLKALQQILADAGYYDQTLQLGKNDSAFGLQDFLIGKGLLTANDRDGSIGENTIKALQTFLVNEKYLPRYTEKGYDNIDGMLGNATKNAYNTYLRESNVDGFYGDKTLNAYYNYVSSNNSSVPTNNVYLTNDNYLEELEKFKRSFEEYYPEAYYDEKGKKYTIGTGLTYFINDKGKEIPVKKGDTITQAENLIQLQRRAKNAENYIKLKTQYWDKYPPELKFQILDAMFNLGNASVWEQSPNYQKALREYEKSEGWNDPNYDLSKIFKHADWDLNNRGWLGIRSRMRRNPRSINPEDYNLTYQNQYRDSLRTAYDKKYEQYVK